VGDMFAHSPKFGKIKEKKKKLKSKIVLPYLAAIFIVLMALAAVMPMVAAARIVPATVTSNVTVWSRAEDDATRNLGIMWFGVLPTWTPRDTTTNYLTGRAVMLETDPASGATAAQIVAAEGTTNTIEKIDPQGILLSTDTIFWQDKLAQFKFMVSVDNGLPGSNGYVGVPLIQLINAGQAFFFCNVYEKDKVEPKIPQGSYEILKTALVDVSAFYVCKLRPSGEAGVYVVDLYYLGPQTSEFVSENIVALKVELMPAATGFKVPVWGIDEQNLCVLSWPFADPFRGGFITMPGDLVSDWQKFPRLIPKPEHRWIPGFPNPLGNYAGCDDAALYQRYLLGAQIPIAPNDPADGGIPVHK